MKPQTQPMNPASSARTTASIELRHLRYFLAVAEELNFTRAARRLNVVQQTLSEGIAQLEDMIEVQLFNRATRPVTLTAAALRWLPDAREVVDAAERAQQTAASLRAAPSTSLRVGLAATAAFPLTPTLLVSFQARYPHITVTTQHYDFGDPTGGLSAGLTDVAIVRPPFTAQDLELLVIAREPRYVALSDRHPLAGRTSIRFAEIEDEPWIEVSDSDPDWCAFWRVTALRQRPLHVGAAAHGLEDLLEAARTRQAIGVVPESVARTYPWPELTFVKVTDIPRSDVAVAWRAARSLPHTLAFVAIAREFAQELESRDRTARVDKIPGERSGKAAAG
jgi:DNA-binding transcriptional LysR family regulator